MELHLATPSHPYLLCQRTALSPATKAFRDKVAAQVRDLKSPYIPAKRASMLRREVPRDSPAKDPVVTSASPSYRAQDAPPTPGPKDHDDADDEEPPVPSPTVSATDLR